MIINILYFILFASLVQNTHIRYHVLEFTTSDPRITERCVDFKVIEKTNAAYVKEIYDDKRHCGKLEFFEEINKPYESVDFPAVIKYEWTDSSIIETIHHYDGTLFSEEGFVVPNKIEYILCKSKVIKTKNYFNNKLVDIMNFNLVNIEEADLFMMYSGCETKFNSDYNIKF